MTQPGKPYVILAALEFDETGDCALSEAAGLAGCREGSELHVLHVVSESPDASGSGELLSLQVRLARAPEQLQQRIEAIWAERPMRVTVHIRSGNASKVILQAALDLDADLLVLGSHKRAGLQKFMLGSVAERVIRAARCPTLVAAPKNYRAQQDDLEPPCLECQKIRAASQNQSYWCDRHGRTRLRPRVYTPNLASVH